MPMFIDLTLPIDDHISGFPGDVKPTIKQISTIEKQGWNEQQLILSTHFSTHIDAPKHMRKDGKTLSDYPIESFIGKAILFDVRGQPVIDVDCKGVNDNDIVFFYTGHIKHIYDSSYYENNPVISEQTSNRLIEKNISILGIDSFTPDNDPYRIHRKLFDHNIRIVENLVNLEKITQQRFFCYILPLNIKGADGAPCRVVAQVI